MKKRHQNDGTENIATKVAAMTASVAKSQESYFIGKPASYIPTCETLTQWCYISYFFQKIIILL